MSDHPQDELYELLAALGDGALTGDQAARLTELLRDDAEAREAYYDHLALEAHLRWELRGKGAQPIALAPRDAEIEGEHAGAAPRTFSIDRARGGRERGLFRYAAAAVFLLAAGIAVVMLSPGLRPGSDTIANREGTRSTTQTVATLTEARGAEWAPGSDHDMFNPGASIEAGRLQLRAGSAEFVMQSAAMVTLLGPADVEMLGPNRCRLTRGRVVAHVPASAHGFTVETPTHTIVDLGTVFGVNVDADHQTRVDVFEGRVDVRPNGGSPADTMHLHGGDAYRFAGGRAEPLPANISPAVFDWALAPANTGAGLRVGDRDDNWRIIGPNGKAEPAEAMRVTDEMKYTRGGKASSWWIALPGGREVKSDSTWTFETRLRVDRDDFAALGLRGQYSVDNQVVAIRVNGRTVKVKQTSEPHQHAIWQPFAIPAGLLVRGENVVQFDVYNAASVVESPVALRVEWSLMPPSTR
ncbi:MAG: hypothetical protein GC159_19950 [Phycisphaera sp.]|nr:hypothetical protein [Phycisphaera sp.]